MNWQSQLVPPVRAPLNAGFPLAPARSGIARSQHRFAESFFLAGPLELGTQ
jgi:hypothetical protein